MSNFPSAFIQGTAAGQAAAAAASGAGTAASVDDLFQGLLPMSWRSVHFPYADTELELRQDLAIHKFVDRDGAQVEGTGRSPIQITARIPFINGIARGKWEEWERPLYPAVWRKFFAAFADKSSAVLSHPELGDITCKAESMRTRWAGDVRQGVWVTATWIETDDAVLNFAEALASTSPVANAQTAAADLDAQVIAINPAIVPQPYVPPTSFTDLVTAVRSAVDQVTVFQKETAGQIDNIIYEAQSLEDSLDMAVNASALNWPMYQAAELAKSSAYDLKQTLLSKGKPVGLYTVSKDSTLAQITSIIGTDVFDVMVLNPGLVQQPVITKGTIVRYYVVNQ